MEKLRPARPAIYQLPQWASATTFFESALIPPTDTQPVDAANEVPSPSTHHEKSTQNRVADLQQQINEWVDLTHRQLVDIPNMGVHKRFVQIAETIRVGLRLKQQLDTAELATWLRENPADTKTKQLFLDRYELFNEGLAQLAIIGEAAFVGSNMALPSEVGNPRALLINTGKFAALLGGRRIGPIQLGLVGTVTGAAAIAWRERKLVLAGVGLQLRSIPIFGVNNEIRVENINQAHGVELLDRNRGELLRQVTRSLQKAGVDDDTAGKLVSKTLELGQQKTGRAWKGLVTLRELVVHAGIDPTSPDFLDTVSQALDDDVQYTHTPGREWVVREYNIGRALLTLDSKVCRTNDRVVLSQSSASIAPGAVANNDALMSVAAHYMKPVRIYKNSIVAQSGIDHRRHRNVYRDFFTKGAVLERAAFIEKTVDDILDDVERVANNNGGSFDFKNDLAIKFPIRVICDFLGIPPEDAPHVQRWTDELVRALDAGAGLSLSVLTQGNKSADQFMQYLESMIEKRCGGEDVPGIIGEVASTDQQTRDELLANLVTLSFAGFETTTGLLSMGFAELLNHPKQWAYLTAQLVQGPEVSVMTEGKLTTIADRDLRWMVWADRERKGRLTLEAHKARHERLSRLIEKSVELKERFESVVVQEQALGNAVEEMLRWTTPGSVIPLTLESDYELESPTDATVSGCPVAKGERLQFSKGQTIVVDLTEANRSGCPFGEGTFATSGNEFDISRADNTKHLSFGVSHVCIGADLAVENAKRMIEGVLRRFPTLKLDGSPSESEGQLFMTLTSVPVRL